MQLQSLLVAVAVDNRVLPEWRHAGVGQVCVRVCFSLFFFGGGGTSAVLRRC